MVRLPTVLEFEALDDRLLETPMDKKTFQWPDGVKSVIELLVHLVTYDADDVLLDDNGWIWAKPGTLKNGNRKPDPICLSCMDDRLPDNRYVIRDGYYQMSWHPHVFLLKIAKSCGSLTHTAARLDTAQLLDLDSVDDLSYPFYYFVRNQVFYGAPHEARFRPEDQWLVDWSPQGYQFPKLKKADHPYRDWLAALKRYEAWKLHIQLASERGAETVSSEVLEIFHNKTNALWWFGYANEQALLRKLSKKKMRYQMLN